MGRVTRPGPARDAFSSSMFTRSLLFVVTLVRQVDRERDLAQEDLDDKTERLSTCESQIEALKSSLKIKDGEVHDYTPQGIRADKTPVSPFWAPVSRGGPYKALLPI